MRFSVSVPVLSVQMTVAAPSVSTLVSRRTRTWRRAIRRDAIASASVTVGSRPSGTLATMMPMANTKLAQRDSPSASPITKTMTPTAMASTAMTRLSVDSSR